MTADESCSVLVQRHRRTSIVRKRNNAVTGRERRPDLFAWLDLMNKCGDDKQLERGATRSVLVVLMPGYTAWGEMENLI